MHENQYYSSTDVTINFHMLTHICQIHFQLHFKYFLYMSYTFSYMFQLLYKSLDFNQGRYTPGLTQPEASLKNARLSSLHQAYHTTQACAIKIDNMQTLIETDWFGFSKTHVLPIPFQNQWILYGKLNLNTTDGKIWQIPLCLVLEKSRKIT